MRVRPAVAADSEVLHGFTCSLALGELPQASAHAVQLSRVIASDDCLALVAEDDVVVGYALGGLLPMPLYGAPMALLQELYVAESSRRRGVAGDLIEAFTAWAAGHGATVAAVATSRESARRLYEAKGFITRPTSYYWKMLT